ncbi:ricin b lectin-like protein [Plasmopara halstedii]|uniref:glucan endo-1,3-beta-D-glucosidase n=1 Tax=Plasmopara halstedii TaxID=4781 RepID=A0A0P1AA51_PLAHL|nr:ricin b lectin-like protein [Plasmopara halstedii]CEG37184.1 ricin b lectin-like protein [Plasmopara halstedii]|eukprot:XP_024573553.1 ricin b lectin-like protein [Plasmopara halstedii]
MKLYLSTFVASLVSLLNDANALNVKIFGLNYSARIGADWLPENEKCKSAAQIQKDMYAIKGVTDIVRIYSLVDCNLAEIILPAARNAGLRVQLGIWTTARYSSLAGEKAKLTSLIDSGIYQDSLVVGLHVGSETMYREEIDVNTAISYMNEIRDFLHSRGKYIPVSIADVINVYNANPQLVDAVDEVVVNQFSFWENIDVTEAAARTLDRLKNLRILCAEKGKPMRIGETGWSSSGEEVTASAATPENQAKFFSDFYRMAHAHNFEYYWYVAFDSDWRRIIGEKEVEASFGIFKEDDTMKSNFDQLNITLLDKRAIRNVGSNLLLSENNGAVYMSAKSNDWLVQEQQIWFFDPVTLQIRSMSSDRCLDAYQPWDGSIVYVYRCLDYEGNQKWGYNSQTGQIRHLKHVGFCLDTDPLQENKVQLYGCSDNNPNQMWAVIDPSSI